VTVAEVNAVAQALHDGIAGGDAAALASLYSEEAKFMPPNMEPCDGREEIQAAMQGLIDMGVRSLDVEPLEVHEAGQMTIEYGSYVLGIEPPGAGRMTDVGSYIVVHETQPDGSTLIAYDIFNSNLPAPAQ
jgi:ketosteroid isomerase-like protein